MPAPNLFMNWCGVTLTPSTGSPIPVTEVTDVMIGRRSVQQMFYGDCRAFAAYIRNVEKSRSISIVTGNVLIPLTIDEELIYSIEASLEHADTKDGTGSLTVTLANARLESEPAGGSNNRYASGTLAFNAMGGASDTDPLSVVVTP